MSAPIRHAALLLLLGLAACGKMGALDTPPGSTYPKGYPAGSAVRDLTGANSRPQPVTASKQAQGFTDRGSWIDPNMRRPVIDPNADQDKWHLNESTFGY